MSLHWSILIEERTSVDPTLISCFADFIPIKLENIVPSIIKSRLISNCTKNPIPGSFYYDSTKFAQIVRPNCSDRYLHEPCIIILSIDFQGRLIFNFVNQFLVSMDLIHRWVVFRGAMTPKSVEAKYSLTHEKNLKDIPRLDTFFSNTVFDGKS